MFKAEFHGLGLSPHPLHQGHIVLAQALQHSLLQAPTYYIAAEKTTS